MVKTNFRSWFEPTAANNFSEKGGGMGGAPSLPGQKGDFDNNMKTGLNTSGPNVKTLVSQYQDKIQAYSSTTTGTQGKGPGGKKAEQPVLKPVNTEHLKKQTAPSGMEMYSNNTATVGREGEGNLTVGRIGHKGKGSPIASTNANPPAKEGKQEVFMYGAQGAKQSGAPVNENPPIKWGKQEMENTKPDPKNVYLHQTQGNGKGEQGISYYSGGVREKSNYVMDADAPRTGAHGGVKWEPKPDMPAKYEHNYGEVKYLKGAEAFDPQDDWKTKGAPMPQHLKGYAFTTPGFAIEGLKVEKPGSFAFYQPETRTHEDGQKLEWELAMKRTGGNQELAAAMMYQSDSTRLGVAVKGEKGEVTRFEVPMQWANQFPTQESLMAAVSKEMGQKLDPAKMADASWAYRTNF